MDTYKLCTYTCNIYNAYHNVLQCTRSKSIRSNAHVTKPFRISPSTILPILFRDLVHAEVARNQNINQLNPLLMAALRIRRRSCEIRQQICNHPQVRVQKLIVNTQLSCATTIQSNSNTCAVDGSEMSFQILELLYGIFLGIEMIIFIGVFIV